MPSTRTTTTAIRRRPRPLPDGVTDPALDTGRGTLVPGCAGQHRRLCLVDTAFDRAAERCGRLRVAAGLKVEAIPVQTGIDRFLRLPGGAGRREACPGQRLPFVPGLHPAMGEERPAHFGRALRVSSEILHEGIEALERVAAGA